MNKLRLIGAAALIATSFLPESASAQRGGGGMRGGGMGGFTGGGIGGGFRGGGMGGGFRGGAIGGGFGSGHRWWRFPVAAIGPGFQYDFVKLDDLTFGPGPFLGHTFTASREI